MRKAFKLLSIDPGTTNLGWAWMEDFKVLKAGNDFLWRREGRENVRIPVHQATAKWIRRRQAMFEEADFILIEGQFHQRGAMSHFVPMIVMDSIIGACEFAWPGKLVSCHPQAVKNYFNIRGTYEQRKAEVTRRYEGELPSAIRSRSHDALDAMLNAWWWLETKQHVTRPTAPCEAPTTEQLREDLRESFPLQPKTARRARRKRAF